MEKLLRGNGEFVADVAPDGALYAAFVRAEQPGSVLQSLDASGVTDDGEIKLVLPGENLREALGSLRNRVGALESDSGVSILAHTKTLYLGEPIALLIATTPTRALDGVERIGVDVIDRETGFEQTLIEWCSGEHEKTLALIEQADFQLTTTLRVPRISATPMEPVGAIGNWSTTENRLSLTAPTQGVHRFRDELCAMLGIENRGLRVLTGDVGGGFGGRIHALRERQESMVAEFHARDLVTTITAGFEKTGKIVGVAADMQTNCGAALSVNYTPIITQYFAAGLSGAYAIAHLAIRVKAVASTRTPTAAFRGAGQPEGCYVIERVMDDAARALGLSAVGNSRTQFSSGWGRHHHRRDRTRQHQSE